MGLCLSGSLHKSEHLFLQQSHPSSTSLTCQTSHDWGGGIVRMDEWGKKAVSLKLRNTYLGSSYGRFVTVEAYFLQDTIYTCCISFLADSIHWQREKSHPISLTPWLLLSTFSVNISCLSSRLSLSHLQPLSFVISLSNVFIQSSYRSPPGEGPHPVTHFPCRLVTATSVSGRRQLPDCHLSGPLLTSSQTVVVTVGPLSRGAYKPVIISR